MDQAMIRTRAGRVAKRGLRRVRAAAQVLLAPPAAVTPPPDPSPDVAPMVTPAVAPGAEGPLADAFAAGSVEGADASAVDRPDLEPDPFDSRQFKWGDTWPLVSTGRGTYGHLNIPSHTGDPHSWVRIGNYCSIALGVEFMHGGNHRLDWVSTFPFRIVEELPGAYEDGLPWSKGDIVVGSDVWIGRDAIILGGVTIGHGAVVGAHAIVTRDVRPYAIVAGNPAREIRRRFPDEVVDALLEAAWWDWHHEEIVAIVDILNSVDSADTGPERLVAYARERPGHRGVSR